MTQAVPASRSRRSPRRSAAPAPSPTLRILETRVLRGPNYWAREPVVRLLVDLGVLEQFPTNKLPGFTDALVALLPTLEDHACSLGRRGGFITRLRDGTWAGHVAEHVALEFQNLAGTDVRATEIFIARAPRPSATEPAPPRNSPFVPDLVNREKFIISAQLLEAIGNIFFLLMGHCPPPICYAEFR